MAKYNYLEPKDASQLYSGAVSVGFSINSDKAFNLSNKDWTLEQFTFISENQVVIYYLYDEAEETEIINQFLIEKLNSITLDIDTKIVDYSNENLKAILDLNIMKSIINTMK